MNEKVTAVLAIDFPQFSWYNSTYRQVLRKCYETAIVRHNAVCQPVSTILHRLSRNHQLLKPPVYALAADTVGYYKITNTGNSTATGIFRLEWEERP